MTAPDASAPVVAPSLADRVAELEGNADRATAATVVEAEALRDAADYAGEHGLASVAARVLGVTRRNTGDLPGSAEAFASAIAHARQASDESLEGRARISLTGLHIAAGDLAAAEVEAARAAPMIDVVDRSRLDVQLAVAEGRAGRFAEAVARNNRSEQALVSADDVVWLARLRLNRGIALAYLGLLEDAVRDTESAARLIEGRADRQVALISLNRAWIAGLAADVPTALARYDEAARLSPTVGVSVGLIERDRAELLARVGLWDEAVEAASAAVADLERTSPIDLPEARLVLAEALVGAGRPEHAAHMATTAESEFSRQDRAVWVARALVTRLTAAIAGSTATAADVAAATVASLTLHTAGLASEAAEARAVAARVALSLGAGRPAVATLVPVAGPPWTRARVWHAEAERRLALGDRRGAARAAAAGLDAVEPLRAALGSVELRAGLASTVTALADLGVRLAIERRPRAALAWAERRGGGFRGRGRAVPDRDLAAAVASLRAVASEPPDERTTANNARRLHVAEHEVRRLVRRSRAAPSIDGPDRGPRLDVARLGDRTLLRYIAVGDDLWLIHVKSGRARRHYLGKTTLVKDLGDRLRFGLRRAAAGGPAAMRAAHAVRASAAVLTDAVLPTRALDGAIVIIPDGPLHAVPWHVLPPLADIDAAVAPSFRAWVAASERLDARPASSAIFVAGPGVPGAESEARAAAAAWGRHARVIAGPAARVEDVVAAAGTADLAHLSCHGSFRAESPMFSTLALADGPMFVHDLFALERAPTVVVLGACEVGDAVAVAGAELLGLAAGFLDAGAASVVASVLPLPDDAITPALADFAGRVAAGASPAAALAEVRTAAPIAAALCCFGAG